MNTSSQLQLFADKCVAWETLPETCQQTVRELLSLLLEQTQQETRLFSLRSQCEKSVGRSAAPRECEREA